VVARGSTGTRITQQSLIGGGPDSAWNGTIQFIPPQGERKRNAGFDEERVNLGGE